MSTKDYFGFIYKWTDSKNGMMYIGSHYGSEMDSYKGSNIRFQRAIKKRPSDFRREILEYVMTDSKNEILKCEQKWLDSVFDIKSNLKYFNQKNEALGGWSFINASHIKKRSKTLKQKHNDSGLSNKETKSYKTKIETRLERISKSGFTDKEKEQHNSYSTQVEVIFPDNTKKIFSSISQCSRELNINAKYGTIVTKNGKSYKGYKIFRIKEPAVLCKRNKNESI